MHVLKILFKKEYSRNHIWYKGGDAVATLSDTLSCFHHLSKTDNIWYRLGWARPLSPLKSHPYLTPLLLYLSLNKQAMNFYTDAHFLRKKEKKSNTPHH